MSNPTKETKPEKRFLGRGFASLLPSTTPTPVAAGAPAVAAGTPLTVAVDKIHRNPQQPRQDFSPQALEDLTNSIRQKGVLQPLLVQVRPNGEYELIAGERRLRAATLAGLRQVPVVVRQSSPEDSLEVAIIENVQRADLNPVEEALGYQSLIQRFQLTQEDVAKKVGKSRSAIANALRLLQLPNSVRQYLRDGQLTVGQVRPLIGMGDEAKITAMVEQILKQGLSARAVEQTTTPLKNKKSSKSKKSIAVLTNPRAALKEQLRRHFGTKIEILESAGQGRIEIHYYSTEELSRIVQLLGI